MYRPRTSILEVPHEFKSRHGSSALWQGALSSLPSLSEETLSRRVGPVYRRVTPYARKRTHFTYRKEQGEIPMKWSVKHTENGCMMSTPRGSPSEGYTQQCVTYKRRVVNQAFKYAIRKKERTLTIPGGPPKKRNSIFFRTLL